MTTPQVLTASGLVKTFGAVRAVDGVDFDVRVGEIHGLIGPNGSGKTTLLNVLSGLLRVDSGSVLYGKQRTLIKRPDLVAASGVARTYQEVQLFWDMSVLDNVELGAYRMGRAGVCAALHQRRWVREEQQRAEAAARTALEFVGLDADSAASPRNVPYGHKRLLEIARCLAGQPEVLLLDEPAAGLNPSETSDLMDLVRKIAATGCAVVVVEHNMRLVMGISDRISVLDQGKLLAEGPPNVIAKSDVVLQAYLGTGE